MRIILVRPRHPGNIGATARAMKTMGVNELYLVAPRQFPHPEASALATHATDILQKAQITENLPQALATIQFVYATSANHRAHQLPTLTARQAVQQMQQQGGQAAVMFGTENHGLSNDELKYAHYLVNIPSASDYYSLNLAAAVQILVYEWQQLQQVSSGLSPVSVSPVVAANQLECFYQRLEQILIRVKMLNPQRPRQLMLKLRRLFNRCQVDTQELQILQGFLTAIENH